MIDRLNILVLHNLGDPATWRESMVEKEFCLPRFGRDHEYVVHDCALPLPDYVRDIAFDGVVMTQTFLSKRKQPEKLARLDAEFAFLKDARAFKITLPQDDYTSSRVLDRWLVDWKVDLNYPVCTDGWDLLYPTFRGRQKLGYTGYISDDLIARTRSVKPIADRRIDVSYRASNLSPVFGRLGRIKSEIGLRFAARAAKGGGAGLRLDLSTDPKDTVLGTRWYDFIEDSRCMLGVNSGASLQDPEGKINLAVHRYLQRNPHATFEEVEAACFPGLDGIHTFTAISPRNMECALLGTVQVLTPGPYGGFLEPWKHYLPIDPEMADFDEVARHVKDQAWLAETARACKEEILGHPELRYPNHVADLVAEIRAGSRVTDAERAAGVPLIRRYREEMPARAEGHWRRKRMGDRLRDSLANLGARKAKYILMDLLKVE